MVKRGRPKKKKEETEDNVSGIVADIISELEGDISSLSSADLAPPTEFLTTGNYALNWCMSGRTRDGGFPGGRITDLFGDPSTGKSHLIYRAIAEAQKKGGYAILDDTEAAYSPAYGVSIGIDNTRLLKLKSDTVEEHFSAVDKLLSMLREKIPADAPIVVALDSIANLSTTHEMETGWDKEDMGRRAKQIKKGIRKIMPYLKGDPMLFYVIANHVIASMGYGAAKTTPGGSGVPFQASIRAELKIDGNLKKSPEGKITMVKQKLDPNDQPVGVVVKAYMRKNKVVYPFRQCVFDVRWDRKYQADTISGLPGILIASGVCSKEKAPAKKKGGKADKPKSPEGEKKKSSWFTLKATGEKFQAAQLLTDEDLLNRVLNALDNIELAPQEEGESDASRDEESEE